MKKETPWVAFVWFMAKRLELAIWDALKDVFFEEGDDMILRIKIHIKNSENYRLIKEYF